MLMFLYKYTTPKPCSHDYGPYILLFEFRVDKGFGNAASVCVCVCVLCVAGSPLKA